MSKRRINLTTEAYLGLFLMLILLGLAALAPKFFDLNNIMSLLNRFSYVLIAAIGMNLIVLTGNIACPRGR